jgi:hypothetical protein
VGRLADEHGSGLGNRLKARRRIDEITRNHPLVRRADRDGGLAREDTGPRLDPRAEGRHRVDEIEPGPHGALGVILAGDRSAPHGHDRRHR